MSVLPCKGEEFCGSLGILRDTSVRKERERQLRDAKERLQSISLQAVVGNMKTTPTAVRGKMRHTEKFRSQIRDIQRGTIHVC